MSKQTFFYLMLLLFIVVLIIGPVKHLRTGVVEFQKKSYPQGKRLIRRNDPEKFYAYVVFEFLSLMFFMALGYYMMFHSNVGP